MCRKLPDFETIINTHLLAQVCPKLLATTSGNTKCSLGLAGSHYPSQTKDRGTSDCCDQNFTFIPTLVKLIQLVERIIKQHRTDSAT